MLSKETALAAMELLLLRETTPSMEILTKVGVSGRGERVGFGWGRKDGEGRRKGARVAMARGF